MDEEKENVFSTLRPICLNNSKRFQTLFFYGRDLLLLRKPLITISMTATFLILINSEKFEIQNHSKVLQLVDNKNLILSSFNNLLKFS